MELIMSWWTGNGGFAKPWGMETGDCQLFGCIVTSGRAGLG